MEYYVLNKYGTYFVVTVRPLRPIFSELEVPNWYLKFWFTKIYLFIQLVRKTPS